MEREENKSVDNIEMTILDALDFVVQLCVEEEKKRIEKQIEEQIEELTSLEDHGMTEDNLTITWYNPKQ